MSTTDRDTRIKTHPAAARHPELVQRLLARDWDLDKCMRSLAMADATPPSQPVAPATPASATHQTTMAATVAAGVMNANGAHVNPATEAETMANSIIAAYRNNSSQGTEAETVAAGVLTSYRLHKPQTTPTAP